MAGPQQVLHYLGRYTHRIAISNERLLEDRDGRVSFLYKDRAHGGRRKSKTLAGSDFTRGFLRHVVPSRFVRVRHYGLLANGVKKRSLARARSLLGVPAPPEPSADAPTESWHEVYRRIVGSDPLLCPACHLGRLEVVDVIAPSTAFGKTAPASRSP